jgi:hypothetical protein
LKHSFPLPRNTRLLRILFRLGNQFCGFRGIIRRLLSRNARLKFIFPLNDWIIGTAAPRSFALASCLSEHEVRPKDGVYLWAIGLTSSFSNAMTCSEAGRNQTGYYAEFVRGLTHSRTCKKVRLSGGGSI